MPRIFRLGAPSSSVLPVPTRLDKAPTAIPQGRCSLRVQVRIAEAAELQLRVLLVRICLPHRSQVRCSTSCYKSSPHGIKTQLPLRGKAVLCPSTGDGIFAPLGHSRILCGFVLAPVSLWPTATLAFFPFRTPGSSPPSSHCQEDYQCSRERGFHQIHADLFRPVSQAATQKHSSTAFYPAQKAKGVRACR